MGNEIFKNVIGDKQMKEKIGDIVISMLANEGLISFPKDLKHLVIEFGYLFLREGSDIPITMLKVMPPKKLFGEQKVFYFGSQDNKLLLLNDSFNENTFRKIQNDMFVMHKVDITTINWNEYKMELY